MRGPYVKRWRYDAEEICEAVARTLSQTHHFVPVAAAIRGRDIANPRSPIEGSAGPLATIAQPTLLISWPHWRCHFREAMCPARTKLTAPIQ